MKKFNSVCLVTPDVLKLRAFYETVLQAKAEGDAVFSSFSINGLGLSLYTPEGMEQMAPGSTANAGTGSAVLEFEVEDVDVEYQHLCDLNVPIVKPPTTQPWGLRSVWFRDPDGRVINFYARVSVP
jgi:catechol 2,3-dioxygenase-like lactoylglutathione lyase family enzyme